MIKKIALSSCIALAVFNFSNSQSGSGFGLKGGLNYGSNGDLSNAFNNAKTSPDSNLGYHLGVFGKLKILGKFYLRPELIYTKTQGNYKDDGLDADFDVQKIDAPILFGIDIIGPLSAFTGPSIQYILDTNLSDNNLSDVENELSVGFNFGVALSLGKVGIDLRYERGFSKNEIDILDRNNINLENIGTIDTRPEQLILSFSLKL